MRGVLRVYSWVFEAVLSAMALAVAAVTLLSGNEELKLGWLPWDQKNLAAWLIGFGTLGLVLVLLAVAGRFRVLLFLFALVVFVMLGKGFFYGLGYSFESAGQWKNAGILIIGSFIAFLGAWPDGGGRRRRVGQR